jgi:hypothetical protein
VAKFDLAFSETMKIEGVMLMPARPWWRNLQGHCT